MANVTILNEVSNGDTGDWRLCFQWCSYEYDDGSTQNGYRFIWRRPDDSLQPARGQARIPNASELLGLIHQATVAGWFITSE